MRVTLTHTHSQGSTLALKHTEEEVHSGHIHWETITGEYIRTRTHPQGSTFGSHSLTDNHKGVHPHAYTLTG